MDDFDLDPLFISQSRPTDFEIEEIIEYFLDGSLTRVEAEAALARLARVEEQVLPHLLELVLSPEPDEYEMGCALLRKLRIGQAIEPLWGILENPLVEDDHKMSILQVLQTLDGISPDDDPLRYLENPTDWVEKSQDTFLSMLQNPVELEMILQATFEGEMPALLHPEILQVMASAQDFRLMPFLLCLLHAPQDDLVLGAIDAIASFSDPALDQILRERASFDPSKKVRQAARNAVEIPQEQKRAFSPSILGLPLIPPPLNRCLISTIDGSGGQVVLIVRQREGQPPVFCNMMFNDHEGCKDCFGGQASSIDQVETMVVDGMAELGVGMVEISLQRVRFEIERAYQVTLAARRRLPFSFMGWQSWLAGDDPDPIPVYSPPDPKPAEHGLLLERCTELFDLDEFESWVFNPDELMGLEHKYWKLQNYGPAPDAIQILVSETIHKIINDTRRRQLRERLRRQAWLLAQIYEDDDIPKLALAAAAELEDSGTRPGVDHPLLREMILRSFAYAVPL